jgi:hypothetical protein
MEILLSVYYLRTTYQVTNAKRWRGIHPSNTRKMRMPRTVIIGGSFSLHNIRSLYIIRAQNGTLCISDRRLRQVANPFCLITFALLRLPQLPNLLSKAFMDLEPGLHFFEFCQGIPTSLVKRQGLSSTADCILSRGYLDFCSYRFRGIFVPYTFRFRRIVLSAKGILNYRITGRA